MKIAAQNITQTEFCIEVNQGLSSSPKYLSSKYFYDSKGSEIFRKIMRMPEYYLTNCEYDILHQSKDDILQFIHSHATPTFDLVELGPGDGLKTKILLAHFLDQAASFEYMPIDISDHAMQQLVLDLHHQFPNLTVNPQVGTYHSSLHKVAELNHDTNVILFMGSNIGNFSIPDSIGFLQDIFAQINSGDLLIVGFDLQKDPNIIHRAYSDPAGLTRDFNLNLLTRINSELGGNFDLQNFQHYETYNPLTGQAESFLVSRKKQSVSIQATQKTYTFDAWETIHTEISQKYSESMIDHIAHHSGFKRLASFYDARQYFVDVVFQKP